MKGKHSSQVSERLRTEAQAVAAERDTLRRQLAEVTKERDRLEAWKAKAETDGLPGVIAERERADALARRMADDLAGERLRWRLVFEDFEPTLRALFRVAKDRAVIDDDGMVALTAMYGDRMTDVMTGKPATRNQRRNTRTASALRSHMSLLNEAKKIGVL